MQSDVRVLISSERLQGQGRFSISSLSILPVNQHVRVETRRCCLLFVYHLRHSHRGKSRPKSSREIPVSTTKVEARCRSSRPHDELPCHWVWPRPLSENVVVEMVNCSRCSLRWSWSSAAYLILSYLSRSLADRWGTTVDFTTSFLHSSRFSAFRSIIFHSRPVHSLMLSSHRFLCLPQLLRRLHCPTISCVEWACGHWLVSECGERRARPWQVISCTRSTATGQRH